MPNSDARPFDTVQFKVAHNAYRLREDISTLLDEGFRGLELDIHRQGSGWKVAHTGKERGLGLDVHLSRLRDWSRRTPGHDPVVLHIDMKSVVEDVKSDGEAVSRQVREGLGRDRIYSASDRRGEHPSLISALKHSSWPTMTELSGKFLVCVTGNRFFKEQYAKHREVEQLCFCDFDVIRLSGVARVEERGRAFLNVEWTGESSARILDRLRSHRGFIVRVYTANSPHAWQRLRKLGPALIAADASDRNRDPWATMGDLAFADRYGPEANVT